MAKLTLDQYLELNENLVVDENGNTNKKCPLCGNSVVVEHTGTAVTIRCKTSGCFSSTGRGI